MDTLESTRRSNTEKLSFDLFRNEVLKDYKPAVSAAKPACWVVRRYLPGKPNSAFSVMVRKFFAQVAMAKFFRNGDFRSGYYRDQTFMFFQALATVEQFFAQPYADPDVEHDPFSAGPPDECPLATLCK